jgi:predicted RNA-binding protein with RPS1 domain
MAGPAGVRRRLPVPHVEQAPVLGPPEPTRCPHCGWEVLHLAVHLAEAHPEQPQEETEAEREAREREAARQAAVAAEIARREAEAALRKAEARARRQAVEGPQSPAAVPTPAHGAPPSNAPRAAMPGRPADAVPPAEPTGPAHAGGSEDSRRAASGDEEERLAGAAGRRAPAGETWEGMKRALAQRTVLTGVIRTRKPFGVFVDLGGIDGLVREREMLTGDAGSDAPLRPGQTVKVVVIRVNEDGHRVELSMKRAAETMAPGTTPRPAGRDTRPAEGSMALAFRLAQERKKRGE